MAAARGTAVREAARDARDLTTALGSVASLATPDAILADGGEMFSVTFTSATPFLSADLSGGENINLVNSFSIDGIAFDGDVGTVPAPPGYLIIGLGVLLPLVRRPRPRREDRT